MISLEHISHLVFQCFHIDFEHEIVPRVGFFHYKHQILWFFPLKMLQNDCFLKIFFPRSITFVHNHKVIEHFYQNNAYLNDIFHFVSARNSSLCKQISWVKIKGAIIIHVKFSGARKLKILRCFRTLHVQILSGFKNWDIQDLRRCDTMKSC